VHQIIAIVGPTASGKTDVAIELAAALHTEILSADSMQFYRGMEIGTGQPTPAQLARVKHHFIGHLSPEAFMSAAEFSEAARPVVARLNAAGKPAVVCGGSGLYIRALIDGLFEGPGRSCDIRQRLHAQADAGEMHALYAQLQTIDPAYAATVYPTDLRRIVRALEVHELTGKPLSAHHAEQQAEAEPFDTAQFGLDWPREILYERVNRRVEAMFATGLVEEVKTLQKSGNETHMERLKSLGYREVLAHLRGQATLPETISAIQMNHRRYAKRQLTWFRRDTRIHWIRMDASAAEFQAKPIAERIGQTLCA